jgi:hypothetical protein
VAVADDAVHGLEFSRAGDLNSDVLTGHYQTIAAGASWHVRAGLALGMSMSGGGQVNGGGIFIGDGTKIMTLRLATSSGSLFFSLDRWTDASTYASSETITNPLASWAAMIAEGMPAYWHAVCDGTNLAWYLSMTGRLNQARNIFTAAKGAYLGTITRAGIALRGNDGGSTAVPTKIWMPDWKNE